MKTERDFHVWIGPCWDEVDGLRSSSDGRPAAEMHCCMGEQSLLHRFSLVGMLE